MDARLLPSTIAIDGPAASGKSTIGEQLARRLGYVFLDTGVMYRAVTWMALVNCVDIEDEAEVTRLARKLRIDVQRRVTGEGSQQCVLADGRDVTSEIRQQVVDRHVSQVSTYAGVRAALTRQQRRMARRGRIVMVGRDIGTHVMPDADLKVFLDASLEERVRRRYQEMLERGQAADYEQARASVRDRDEVDSHRTHAPLKLADGAIGIDTTNMSVEEVLDQVLALVGAQPGGASAPQAAAGPTAEE